MPESKEMCLVALQDVVGRLLGIIAVSSLARHGRRTRRFPTAATHGDRRLRAV